MDTATFNLRKLLVLIASVAVVIFVWMWVSSPMIVTVTGVGEVSVPATNATVSFTLSATDQTTPQNAISNVNAKALAFRTFLQSSGISEGDIAESQVTAVPAGLLNVGTSGYQATISMAAKTTNVSNISLMIADLYSQGALVVAQPILSVENQDLLDQQAFKMAMDDARSQAAKIGTSNLKFIRKVVSVSQVNSPTTSTATTKAETLEGSEDSVAAENGVFKLVKAVSVTYKMW